MYFILLFITITINNSLAPIYSILDPVFTLYNLLFNYLLTSEQVHDVLLITSILLGLVILIIIIGLDLLVNAHNVIIYEIGN